MIGAYGLYAALLTFLVLALKEGYFIYIGQNHMHVKPFLDFLITAITIIVVAIPEGVYILSAGSTSPPPHFLSAGPLLYNEVHCKGTPESWATTGLQCDSTPCNPRMHTDMQHSRGQNFVL